MTLTDVLSYSGWILNLSGVFVIGRALLRKKARVVAVRHGAAPVIRTSRDTTALVIGFALMGAGFIVRGWGSSKVVTKSTDSADVTIVGPAGWINVSPGAPPSNFERLPAEIAARVRTVPGNALLFVDMKPAGVASFTGSIVLGGGPISEAMLEDIVGPLSKQLEATPVVREFTRFAGRRLGHVRLRAADGATTDVYFVPGRSVHALMSFTLPEGVGTDEERAMAGSIEATARTAPTQ